VPCCIVGSFLGPAPYSLLALAESCSSFCFSVDGSSWLCHCLGFCLLCLLKPLAPDELPIFVGSFGSFPCASYQGFGLLKVPGLLPACLFLPVQSNKQINLLPLLTARTGGIHTTYACMHVLCVEKIKGHSPTSTEWYFTKAEGPGHAHKSGGQRITTAPA
jgi:hypothetical protein